jgi:hypothetical protein
MDLKPLSLNANWSMTVNCESELKETASRALQRRKYPSVIRVTSDGMVSDSNSSHSANAWRSIAESFEVDENNAVRTEWQFLKLASPRVSTVSGISTSESLQKYRTSFAPFESITKSAFTRWNSLPLSISILAKPHSRKLQPSILSTKAGRQINLGELHP